MMTPIKFLSWILGVVFALGLVDSFVSLTYKMGQAAIYAHMHDQMSYSAYTKLLWRQAKTVDNEAVVSKKR